MLTLRPSLSLVLGLVAIVNANPTTTSHSSPSSTSSADCVVGTGRGKFWFSFGDSYTQTSFNVTGVQPSESNQLGNPPYPGGTWCSQYDTPNSPNWVDYLATKFNTVKVKVYNYAYGGATIDATIVPSYTPTILSLTDQVNEYLKFDAPGKSLYPGWSSTNSLFSFWIGINDIELTYNNGTGRSEFDAKLINRYFQLVDSVYNTGARNFLFLTVPPVERTPVGLNKTAELRSLEKTVIADYNRQLAAKVTSYTNSHKGVTSQLYDTQPLINDILDHPTRYGLKDATSIGNATNLPWCDVYHIAPPIHYQLAKSISPLIRGSYI